MTDEAMIEFIFRYVRTGGTLIPRGFQSIGSFWAVDRWEHSLFPGLEVQLQDEGYTQVVIVKDVLDVAYTHGRPVAYYKGDRQTLETLYQAVTNG